MSLILAGASCNRAPPPPRALVWDLSNDNQLARVGWPAGLKEHVWYVDGPGTIRLITPCGRDASMPYWFAQVWKVDNVRTVCIMLPPTTVEEAHAEAIRLADQWEILDRRGIDDFLSTRGKRILSGSSGNAQGATMMDGIPPRAIEIRHVFASERDQWQVTLAVGFPDHLYAKPASVPATQSRP